MVGNKTMVNFRQVGSGINSRFKYSNFLCLFVSNSLSQPSSNGWYLYLSLYRLVFIFKPI